MMKKIIMGLILAFTGIAIFSFGDVFAAPLETASNASEFSVALANVDGGGTIQLTASFDLDDYFDVDTKDVTLGLNGYTLTTDGTLWNPGAGAAVVYVADGYTLTVVGPGTLNVTSDTDGYAIRVANGGVVSVDGGAIVNTYSSSGDSELYAEYGSVISITDGEISSYFATALGAGTTVTVSEAGMVEAEGIGATVNVIGVVGNVWADSGGTVNVYGNVISGFPDMACAAIAIGGSKINITGNMTFIGDFDDYAGICAGDESEVVLNGDITVTGPEIAGVVIIGGGAITIKGNISVTQTISDANYVYGVRIEDIGNGSVYVKGSIVVVGNGIGVVLASNDSSVIVDGIVTASQFAYFLGIPIEAGDYFSEAQSGSLHKPGYKLYGLSGDIFDSYLWVKIPTVSPLEDIENPATSDINAAMIIRTSLVAAAGIVCAAVGLTNKLRT